jgi:hypothetical protein
MNLHRGDTDMSTKMIARGIVGSLRLVGVTAAVAAGIAGFATVSATPADAASNVSAAKFQLTDQQGAQLSQFVNKVTLPKITLPAKTCQQMAKANVPLDVQVKLGCVVIPESGEIIGSILF